MKSHDAIVIGAGAIGLSLARKLRLAGLSVLIIEKQEPASESTYAAGGMVAACDPFIVGGPHIPLLGYVGALGAENSKASS